MMNVTLTVVEHRVLVKEVVLTECKLFQIEHVFEKCVHIH